MALTREQQDILLDIQNHPAPITIIQGKAGTGKSFLVKEIVRHLGTCTILCPTNFATLVYRGAQTMHSFFYGEFDDFEEGFQNPNEYNAVRMGRCEDFILMMDTLVIDEVSMVRSDTFEMMSRICQVIRGSNAPFGGIRVIAVGDMLQLPPIVEEEEVNQYLKEEYGGIYFFDSHVIKNNTGKIKYYELEHSVRHQGDQSFERMLDGFRGKFSTRETIQVLNSLNSRVTDTLPSNAVTIASSNQEADVVNMAALTSLPGKCYHYNAKFKLKRKDDNSYKEFSYDPDQEIDLDGYHRLVVPSQFAPQLILKPGVRVVCTASRKRDGYINGDFGTVISCSERGPIVVKIDRTGQSVSISRTDNHKYNMDYDPVSHRLTKVTPYVQKTEQYPIKLAYAFTIHKSQGQTYPEVVLDLNSHIFAPGQLYVALSRAKSLDGLYLTHPISYSDVIIDPRVIEFLNRYASRALPKEFVVQSSRVHLSRIEQIKGFLTDRDADMVVLNSLEVFEDLYTQGQFKYAIIEIQKAMEAINAAYHTEDFENQVLLVRGLQMIDIESANKNICDEALATLQSVFAHVHEHPRIVVIDHWHVRDLARVI